MTTNAIILVCAGLGLLSFFLWAALHELSHFLAAKALIGANLLDLKLWPHTYEGVFYWASIRFQTVEFPARWEETLIHLAPRIPGCIAAVALPFVALLASPWCWFVSVLVGAALVDISVGSIGWSPTSDLRRAAKTLAVPPWSLRVVGWTAVATSAGSWTAVVWLG